MLLKSGKQTWCRTWCYDVWERLPFKWLKWKMVIGLSLIFSPALHSTARAWAYPRAWLLWDKLRLSWTGINPVGLDRALAWPLGHTHYVESKIAFRDQKFDTGEGKQHGSGLNQAAKLKVATYSTEGLGPRLKLEKTFWPRPDMGQERQTVDKNSQDTDQFLCHWALIFHTAT